MLSGNISERLIKSFFLDPDGCDSVVKLEHLQHHLNSCAYNSDPKSFDDNKKLSRNDFESMYNCSSHLLHRVSEMIHQPEHFRDTIHRQKQKLEAQDNHITQLNDEINRLRLLVSGQQNNVAMTVPSLWTKQWQKICNMKISKDKPNIFESSTEDNGATVQLLNSLQPSNSSFKVEILQQGVISIGLTSTDHPIHNSMGTAMGYYEDSIGYCSKGSIVVDSKEASVSRNWQIGEIIECGIIFPYNFVNCGNQIVTAYFTKNNELAKVTIKMPSENFFPTIMIDFGIGKVKYLN